MLRRREGNDIWKDMHEFMLIESKTAISETWLFSGTEVKAFCPGHLSVWLTSQSCKHVLNHQLFMAGFYVLTQAKHKKVAATAVLSIKKLKDFTFPERIEKFLVDCELKEIL